MEEVVADLNDFWAENFRALGREYSGPSFVKARARKKIRSECGTSRGRDHSYCPAERTVYADYDSDDEESLYSLWEDDRALLIVGTLGHEWGHHAQRLLDLMGDEDDDEGEAAIQNELQADCLMGVFIHAYADANDWVGRADLRDLARDVKDSGDSEHLDRAEMGHGTGRERQAAYQSGYESRSIGACGID